MRVAEPEFDFKMGSDLPPRATPYTVEEVLRAVASLHPAIEIPDSRYSVFTKVGAAQLIADNACAHEFVLGPATTADWRKLDLAQHRVIGRVGTRIEREGKGANVLDDPAPRPHLARERVVRPRHHARQGPGGDHRHLHDPARDRAR